MSQGLDAKARQLRRRFLTETGVMAAVLGVLGGGVWYLDGVSQAPTTESQTLEGQVNAITNEMRDLRSKFLRVQQEKSVYDEVVQNSVHGGLTINGQSLRDRFETFSGTGRFANLHVSMTPVQDTKDIRYRRKDATICSSNVQVTFEAMSDEDVYGLLQDIGQLPGASTITGFSLATNTALTEPVLQAIAEKGTYPVLKGQMKFSWLGIKAPEPAAAAAGRRMNSPGLAEPASPAVEP